MCEHDGMGLHLVLQPVCNGLFSGRIATSGETSSPKSLSCRPWI